MEQCQEWEKCKRALEQPFGPKLVEKSEMEFVRGQIYDLQILKNRVEVVTDC